MFYFQKNILINRIADSFWIFCLSMMYFFLFFLLSIIFSPSHYQSYSLLLFLFPFSIFPTLSLSLSLSLSVSLSLQLYFLSVSLSHTHTHTLSLSLSLLLTDHGHYNQRHVSARTQDTNKTRHQKIISS